MEQKTKKAKADKPGASSITDIPHEHIPNQPQTNTATVTEVEAEVIPLEKQISLELAKFNKADLVIDELKRQYGGLKINGQEDKEGYKLVKKAWGEVRSARTGFEKKKKEIKADYITIGKAIDKEEERLVDRVTPLEEELYKEWKRIDDEKEEGEKARLKEEEDRLLGRVTELVALGMRMVDGFYSLGETITMDVASLRAMPDDKYEALLNRVRTESDRIKKEKDEKDELDRQAKIKQDQEREQLELDRKKLEQDKQEMETMRQNMEKQKREMRKTQLVALGFKFNPQTNTFTFDNGHSSIVLDGAYVWPDTEEGFATTLDKMAATITEKNQAAADHRAQVEKENQEKERKTKFIHETMTDAGLAWSYKDNGFVFKNSILSVNKGLAELMMLDDENVKFAGHDIMGQIHHAKQTEKENTDKAEKDKQEEAMNALDDGGKWASYMTTLHDTGANVPKFKSKKYQTRIEQFRTRLTTLINEFK